MSIRITVNLILDDEAGDEIEAEGRIGDEDIVARFLKRLSDESIEVIKLHVVGIDDIW